MELRPPVVRRLPDKTLTNGGREISFVEEAHEDHVLRALTLKVDPALMVRRIEFFADAGFVFWTADRGLVGRVWEVRESSTQDPYPCSLLGDAAPVSWGLISGILGFVAQLDAPMAQFTTRVVQGPTAPAPLPSELSARFPMVVAVPPSRWLRFWRLVGGLVRGRI